MNFGKKIHTVFKRHSSTLSAEAGKKWAGIKAMEALMESKPSIVGLGSGSTIVYAIEHLAKTQLAKTVTCIPTSFQTRQLIIENNLKLGSLEQYVIIIIFSLARATHQDIFFINRFPIIDVTIDGADEIDQSLNAIKGGGGCLFQERLVAQSSRRFILVAGMAQ